MSEPIRILIADDMSKRAVEILQQAGFTVDVKTGMKPEELAGAVGEYDGLGIRSASKVTAAVLANPGKLKIIGRAGVGVDNIDVAAATAKDIKVINTPAGNSTAAAELAIGLVFALARKIPQAAELMRKGVWEKKKFMGVELAGKTLGVLGLGNIGRQAAERGVGLKMRVIAHDPMLPVLAAGAAVPAGVEIVPFAQLVERSDFLTLHVPLTAETKDLFNAAMLARMKKGACIINAARGGVINENDLLEALKSGHLGGAALDVFTKEPPDASPLFEQENLIALPHLGASTKEAQEKVAIELAEVFVSYLRDGQIRNLVNRK
jgi:D-3-phosphoglycerate dehydrogenase